MIAALNHTIVHAKDKHSSAAFLANVLGIEVAQHGGRLCLCSSAMG